MVMEAMAAMTMVLTIWVAIKMSSEEEAQTSSGAVEVIKEAQEASITRLALDKCLPSETMTSVVEEAMEANRVETIHLRSKEVFSSKISNSPSV